MKKTNYIIVLLILLPISLFAKIEIKGIIKNYTTDSKEISVIINEGAEEKKIGSIAVAVDGKFYYSNDMEYVGVVKLQLDANKIIELISDNTPIVFTYDQKLNQFISLESGINAAFHESAIGFFKEDILPQLQAIQTIYKFPKNKSFSKQLNIEIERLNKLSETVEATKYPFLEYYFEVNKQIKEFSQNKDKKDAQKFAKIFENRLNNDSRFLESSGAFKSLLVNYYTAEVSGASTKESVENKLDSVTNKLLDNVVCESDRGQNILQTSLELFKSSKLDVLYSKYLKKAKNLTCKINNDKLKSSISAVDISVGNIAPNYVFQTKIKEKNSLYEIKAKHKVIVFYASWCGHCVKEMPTIIKSYEKLKPKGVEFLVVSLDNDKSAYENFSKNFPNWYNYTELNWNSPVAKAFSIEGTPTMILLDEQNKIKVVSNLYEDVLKELN